MVRTKLADGQIQVWAYGPDPGSDMWAKREAPVRGSLRSVGNWYDASATPGLRPSLKGCVPATSGCLLDLAIGVDCGSEVQKWRETVYEDTAESHECEVSQGWSIVLEKRWDFLEASLDTRSESDRSDGFAHGVLSLGASALSNRVYQYGREPS